MATVTNQYFINLGTSTTTASVFSVQSTGTTGTPAAQRTITHPDLASPTVTYNRNPDRTVNFLSDPLTAPLGSIRRTLGTTLPFRDASVISDVLITEVWEGGTGRASMPASFFKLLNEVWINIPTAGTFVIWDPKDLRTDGRKYNVVVIDIRVGGSSTRLDAKEIAADQLIGLDEVTTGILDKTVEMDLLIRSIVT